MLDQLRKQLLDRGATKLSWSIEHTTVEGHGGWICSFQAANEMGAPVELPPQLEEALKMAIREGQLGALEEDVRIMDLETGRISDPEPRPGDGAGAPPTAHARWRRSVR